MVDNETNTFVKLHYPYHTRKENGNNKKLSGTPFTLRFSIHTTPQKFGALIITGHFEVVVEENSGEETTSSS